jgi:hypothetical protein
MKTQLLAVLTAASLTIAGCSEKSSVEKTSQNFNSLPPRVQQAVRAHAPDAEVASVDKKTRNGMDYYVIGFKEPGRNPKLTIAENGTIVTSDMEKGLGSAGPESGTTTGSSKRNEPDNKVGAAKGTTGREANIDLSALPTPVQKTLKSQAPNGVIKGITRHEENGRMVYEFKFEDEGKNPTMQIAEDGTVVQSLKK